MARKPMVRSGRSTPNVSRRRFIFSTAAGAGAALAGCLGDGDGSDVDEEDIPGDWPDLSGESIYYLAESSDRDYQAFWQEIANRFQTATGAEVTIEFAGHAEGYRDRLIQMVQAGDPPDVTHASLNMASSLGQQDVLADHGDVIEYWEDEWDEEYDDQFRVTLDGADQYLPTHANVFCNWYRSDVFGEEPNTWEKELAMAEEHDEGEGSTRGYFMPVEVGLWANDMKLLTDGWTLGANVFAWDGDELQVVLDQGDNTDLWSQALDHHEELYQYSNSNTDASYSELYTSLGTESAYAAPWVGTHIKINAVDSPVAEDITQTAPAVPEGMDRRMWGNIQGQAVTADGNVEAGLEFLKFLAHPEHCMDYYFAEDLQQDPILESVIEHDLFDEKWEEMKANGPWTDSDLKYERLGEAEFVDWGTEIDPVNPYAFEANTSHPMGQVVWDVLVEGMSHDEALSSTADDLRDLISE